MLLCSNHQAVLSQSIFSATYHSVTSLQLRVLPVSEGSQNNSSSQLNPTHPTYKWDPSSNNSTPQVYHSVPHLKPEIEIIKKKS